MSVLENIYRQMQNEYVETLCELSGEDFLRTLWEIADSPSVTLKKSHVHEIFRVINSFFVTKGGFTQGEYDEITQQLWDSLLRTDGTGLLNPTTDRRNLVSRWFAMDWGGPVLETMTRHADSRPAATDWLHKTRQWQYVFSVESVEKAAIAYEQIYRLAGDRDEKCKALLTAWQFRFSFILDYDIWLYKGGRIDKLLEEHIRHFPEDIPRLREDFRKLIIGYSDGNVRRAGWAGIAVIGAGPHEPQLLEVLHWRLGRERALGRKSIDDIPATMQECNLNMWTSIAEEIEGMTRWIPDAEDNRRILLGTWKWFPFATHRSGRGALDIPKLLNNGNIPVALWRARMKLETSEEQLLKEITATMDENFAEPHQKWPENQPMKWDRSDYKIIGTLGTWQPRSPEIRHRWRELWENCLIRSWDNPHIPEEFQGQFWKNLVNIAPRHPCLVALLMQHLSAEKNREPHHRFCPDFWNSVTSWLREYGLPPETSPDMRQQLAQTAQEYLREILSGSPMDKVRYSEGIWAKLLLHVLLATATDPEGKKPPEQTEVVGEILKNLGVLLEVTDWAHNNPHPPARLWHPLVHRQWEEKLAALTPATPCEETREVLRYFARSIRRDPDFVPPAPLGGQLLSIIRNCEEPDVVVRAARLGGQLVSGGRMSHDFSSLWNEAVRKRETQSWESGKWTDRRLAERLHLIRKEMLLYEISAWLNDNPFKKTTRDGTQKTAGKKTGHEKQSRADRETAERFLLRKLVHIFPEAGDGSCPERKHPEGKYSRLWSPPCVELILRRQTWQGTGKATDRGEVGGMPVPESRPGRTPVFEDKSRLILAPTTPEQMSGTKEWARQPEGIRRRQHRTVPDRH